MPLHPASLTCLQVFNAVVEEGSFSKASVKIGLTQSAVSHRVKQLEEMTGVALINRTTRYMEVTPEGEKLYKQSRINLIELERILSSLTNRSDAPLSLTIISSLATKWLLPKLSEYNRMFPTQPLSVLTDDKIVDLKYEGVDVAIRLTNDLDPALHMSFITDEWVFPVASKTLINSADLISQPKHLLEYPLLLDTVAEQGNDESSWKGWFASQQQHLPEGLPGQSFNRSDMALQAAAAGQGIAMARASLVETDMLDLNLFQQVGKAVKMKYAYYFVCSPEIAKQKHITNLCDWVTKELKQSIHNVRQRLV